MFENQIFSSFTARLSPEPNWPEPISSFCGCLKGCSQSQKVCFSENTPQAWVTHAHKYLLASWPQTKHLSNEVSVILALLSDSSLKDNIAFLGHRGRSDSLMCCHHSLMTYGACLEPWVLFGGACAVTGLPKFGDHSQKGSKSPCIWHFQKSTHMDLYLVYQRGLFCNSNSGSSQSLWCWWEIKLAAEDLVLSRDCFFSLGSHVLPTQSTLEVCVCGILHILTHHPVEFRSNNIACQIKYCGVLNEKSSRCLGLRQLNTWSPVGGDVWGSLGDEALLEDVDHWAR